MPTMTALRRLPRNTHCSRKIEHDARDHVVQHRAGGDADQVAAVVDALDVHARRQDAGAVDASRPRRSTRRIVGTLCAPRRISTMPCTMSSSRIVAGDAESRLVADADLRDVRRRSTGAPPLAATTVCSSASMRADQADAAHHRRLRTDVDGLAADVDVALPIALQHLRDREAVADQPARVDRDLVGLGLAAPAGDVDDPRHRLEAPLEDPVLDGLQVGDANSPAGPRPGSGRSRRSGWSGRSAAARRWAVRWPATAG